MTGADPGYRAVFCDLRTDQVIDVLPLRDVEFDDYIGKPGSLSGTIPVPNPDLGRRVRRVIEGRTSLYLERAGEVWWGGIVWTVTPQSDENGVLTVPVQAATFDSYPARRRIRDDLRLNTRDSADLVTDLWRYVQSAAGGDIGVTYGDGLAGVEQEFFWKGSDDTVVEEAIDQVLAGAGGLEYRIAVYRDPTTGVRLRRLQLGTPQIVSTAAELVLDRPGAVLSYSFPRDATRGGTTLRVKGADVAGGDLSNDAKPMLSAEAVAQNLIDGGHPRIDLSAEFSTVSKQAQLDKIAKDQLKAATGAVVIPTVRIALGQGAPSALLGRTARLRIVDEWFAEGLDARYRVVGLRVTPPERGRPEAADLYLEEL
ncbi:hypothetical protein F4556_004067 [Kitasatospora gansuensis]|uniref:Phage protein D n=1 Tax=Kitasatospora gansuensis TaxID=258050 RepID=A0A7W7SEE5_9ACTN|nr:hypothetical protein [Kitasatospora gansuensis]MBB4948532.1 hypothetical protein [Kitasatospora gansuensis]